MSVKTYLVDLKKEQQAGNYSLFSAFLLHQMELCLARGEQTILFLNKRGHSSTLICTSCGSVKMCKHCDIALTHHRHPGTGGEFMLCHFCGTKFPVTTTCDTCGKDTLKFIGWGTQKVEYELRAHFPKARIARMDMDTTRTKNSHEELYNKMKNGEIDILLGTQVLAKGLDLPNVTLVGILQADTGLHIPDFRASEKIFQLLTQVMGRASRRGQEGAVVIQSFNPENPVIQLASKRDYMEFYEYMIQERNMYQYPPFTKIIKCIYVHKDRAKAYTEAKKMFDFIEKDMKEKKIDGEAFLAPSYIMKQYDKFHYHILLKGKMVHEYVTNVAFPSGWRIDVDPVNTA